jgi:PhnB protein
VSAHPYLFFSGTCTEAMNRYHEVLGGELEVMTHADLPEGAEPMPGAEPHHVMHSALTFPDGGMLMASDDPTGDGGPKVGMGVAFSSPDEATTKAIFDGLADGGEVVMPLSPTFWSPAFGVVNDRFGVQWMVDTAAPS